MAGIVVAIIIELSHKNMLCNVLVTFNHLVWELFEDNFKEITKSLLSSLDRRFFCFLNSFKYLSV